MQNIITILLIAIGLSMDAFSLAILYGTIGLSKVKIFLLSIIVGIFHFFMPILGNKLGCLVFSFINLKVDLVVGIILMSIAIEMFISLKKEDKIFQLVGFGSLLLFGLTVSMDSFSVGIGLSGISSNYLLVVSVFAAVSLSFTFVGLLIGNKITSYFGDISTKIGAIILVLLGLFYIFN